MPSLLKDGNWTKAQEKILKEIREMASAGERNSWFERSAQLAEVMQKCEQKRGFC